MDENCIALPAVDCQQMRPPDSLYFDYAATAPLDRRVFDAMCSVLSRKVIGNAHAKHHPYGSASAMLVQNAREQVAGSISARRGEVVFTSGTTESNNLVIKGLSQYLKSKSKTHIITNAVEHKSVLEPLAQLKAEGFDVTTLLVRPCGMITPDTIERALSLRTGLVCIQAVNNETGTIQPLSQIADMLSGRGILLHADAAQALGKMPFSVVQAGVDFASFSAHKVYGPQGIGALYIKDDRLDLLKPMLVGGGQELGLRSGTLPVALCVGFGEACALIEDDRARLQELRTRFLDRLVSLKPVVYGRLQPDGNVPGILNLRFPGIDNETLVMALPGLAFGLGSACSSTGERLSHVIKAITGSDQAAREAIRLSFGRMTTAQDMNKAADQVIAAVNGIRKLQEVT